MASIYHDPKIKRNLKSTTSQNRKKRRQFGTETQTEPKTKHITEQTNGLISLSTKTYPALSKCGSKSSVNIITNTHTHISTNIKIN